MKDIITKKIISIINWTAILLFLSYVTHVYIIFAIFPMIVLIVISGYVEYVHMMDIKRMDQFDLVNASVTKEMFGILDSINHARYEMTRRVQIIITSEMEQIMNEPKYDITDIGC